MREHGSYQIQLIGQVISTKLIGQWNYETTEHYVNDALAQAKLISDKPWACLIDLTEWELWTPDVWPLLEEANRWSAANNQKYEATITKMATHERVLEKTDEGFSGGVITQVFDNHQKALEWLQSVGIKIE